MGYTNETTHYGIPLPLGSDLTTPMDYNTAAQAVDTALFEASTNAFGAVDTAAEAVQTANAASTTAAGAVSEAQTAHAVADAATTAAGNVSAKVGAGTLDTAAQTIIPAVNELHAALSDLVGLLRNVSQPDGNDLNNITELGMYGIGFYIFDANTASAPVNTNGVCLTFRINATYAVQLALETTGTSVFVRNKANTWSAWRTI